MEKYNTLLIIFKDEIMIEKELKKLCYTWKSYSEILGENPSNFKRKLFWNIDKINRWLSPLNLELVIREKDG
jgi:hypothetical protein